MTKTFVRFERGHDDVVGPTVGPFEFVQITYSLLRDDADKEIAGRKHDGYWEGPDGGYYSDIIIWSEA